MKSNNKSNQSHMFSMPSGFTHNAPSLAGETYTVLPALAPIFEKSSVTASKANNKSANPGSLRSLAGFGTQTNKGAK